MSRVEEGSISVFPANAFVPYEHTADGNPLPPMPLYCPVCGRRVYLHTWNSNPAYPHLRCDGWLGPIPVLGNVLRALSFAKGLHYTYHLPLVEGSRSSDIRYDKYTGRPIGGGR